MSITCFADLLEEARRQPEPQRLLFVFTRAELPDHPTPEQRARFERGEGGVLTPVLCVDKPLDALSDMAALVTESRETGIEWDLVFVAALADRGLAESEVARQLERMVESLKLGNVDAFLALDAAGEAVRIG